MRLLHASATGSRALGLGLVMCVALAAALPAPAQLAVYTDSLQNGFADWSWGTRDLVQAAVVHAGTAAISFEPDSWAGLFFHRDAGFTGTEYEAIELWVRGSGAGGQQVSIAVLSGGSPAGSASLAGFVDGGAVPAGAWAKATGPFSALGLSTGSWDGVWLPDSSGGNWVTRYNWQNDTSNKGMDWFLMKVPDDNSDPGSLPSGPSADRFLSETRSTGGEPMLTVPLIGWTPKNRAKA